MDYDLVAIDLDGTLLDSQHALPARNRAALHRAHAAGLKLVLCTGRAFTETRPVLAEIGLDLDAAVTVFGALITDVPSGRTLLRSALDRDVAGAAASWLRAEGYPVLWLTDPDECGTDGYMLRGPRRHAAVDLWLQRSPCRVEDVDRLPDGCAAPVRLSVIDDPEPLAALSPRLAETFDGQLVHNVLHAPPYRLSLIEAFAPQVNKWFGIEALCRRWGIDPRRTVAIGDDVNDLAMITHAGLGVAMGNGRAELRAAARRVTDINDACGVARVLEELLD